MEKVRDACAKMLNEANEAETRKFQNLINAVIR